MKPKPAGSKRNRIILIYILGVVLPGFVLGYMAFRGIQSDEALREKQTRQELNLAAQDFFGLLYEDLDNTVAISEYISLTLQKDIELKLVQDQLLYLPDEFLDKPHSTDLSMLPDAGWDLEFIDQDYREAIRYHDKKIAEADDPHSIILSLFAKARLYRKLKEADNALEVYEKLIREYPEQFIGEMPALLASLSAQAEIYQMMGDSFAVSKTREQIRESLEHPNLNYNRQSFEMFYADQTDDLSEQIDRTNYLNKFLLNADDYLRNPSGQLVYLQNNGYRDLLISRVDSTTVEAFLIDLNAYFEGSILELIQKTDPDSSYLWTVKDDHNIILHSHFNHDDLPLFAFTFPAPLSGWKLELRKNPEALISSLFSSGRGMYITIFILLSLWLILGLIFTVYMLNQEIKLSRMKSSFISNVSHEFKSPLTSIQHMSELLKMKRVRTEEKKEEFYDSMIEQCEHLSHLIENVLDFSKMEEEVKAYTFEEVDIHELVGSLIHTQKERLAESGINIQFKSDTSLPPIKADKDSLRQVIYNILDNAQKYGSTEIRVLLSPIPDTRNLTPKASSEVISIQIADNGQGISDKDLPYIFDRFYRGDEKKTEGIKGSGIGLTIVKRIVEAHGGQIWAESRESEGTSFFVVLPHTQYQA